MAVRRTVISVTDEGRQFATGNTRSLLLIGRQATGSNDWESWTVRQESAYDDGAGSDFLLGVNFASGSAVLVGADWSELAGEGQTFDLSAAGGAEVRVDVYGQLGGATPQRGTRVPAGSDQRPVTARADNVRVYSATISEDGYLIAGAQVSDYESTFRPVDPDEQAEQTHRFTSYEDVKVALLAPHNRNSAWDATFDGLLHESIDRAEARIISFLGGRDFQAASTATSTEIRVTHPEVILVPDTYWNPVPTIQDENGLDIPRTDYDLEGFDRYGVVTSIRPRRKEWNPQIGTFITWTGNQGWTPPIPIEVVGMARQLAAEIFRSTELPHGLYETQAGGLVYGRRAGTDAQMRASIGHLQRPNIF